MPRISSNDPLPRFLAEAQQDHTGKKDSTALHNLNTIRRINGFSGLGEGPAQHGYGTWGYTILRAVYTPGSDQLFSEATTKLRKWVQYSVQSPRFPLFGTRGQEREMTNSIYNDELDRRLHFDVLEDDVALSLGSDDPPSQIPKLSRYFREWAGSKGGKPGRDDNPRFWDCLVIDAQSMQSLVALPDETPPLRVAVDQAEMVKWRCADDDAFVWILDGHTTAMTPEERSEWSGGDILKIGVRDIRSAWFYREQTSDRYWGLLVQGEEDVRPGWYDGKYGP